MELYFEIAGNQIDGARDYQEDAFMITHLDGGEGAESAALLIMADGMGGHAAGNVASNMATSTFNKSFSGDYPTDNIPESLKKALLNANDAIGSAVKETPGLQGMGCTMVTAFVCGDKLWWISVGDSHLYLLRERQLMKKNADHSYGGYLKMMREQGMEVEADPKLSPNMLMSAMIGDEIAEMDVSEDPVELRPGDRVIVASDGLDTLGQGAVIQYAAWSDTPKKCVEALLQAVEEANQPRQDNTTVIAIDVKERAESGATAAAPAEPEEDDESEDITQPDTVEKQDEEIILDDSYALEEEVEELSTEAIATEETAEGGGKGMMLGIIALVVLALGGGGAYFMLNGKKETTPPVVEAPQEQAVEPEPTTETAPPEPPIAKETPKQVAKPAPKPEPAPTAKPPSALFTDALKDGRKGPEMVRIPAGEFEMGGRSSLARNEHPRHAVRLKSFAMSRYEITFAQYSRFAKSTGRKQIDSGEADPESSPVVQVTWDEAYAYANWLSKQTGHTYRLPSEAEWEYAARAGSAKRYWWGNTVGKKHAHCFDCKSGLHPRQPAEIGFFKPSPWGLYDTSGNVAEWVHDCYHKDYKGAPEDGSVWEGGDCSLRVVRGGSFSSPGSAIRSSKREKLRSIKSYNNVGIRLARDLN